jgi:hypothetical protein
MMTVLRYASPAKLRAKIGEFRRDHAIDALIDNIFSRPSADEPGPKYRASHGEPVRRSPD